MLQHCLTFVFLNFPCIPAHTRDVTPQSPQVLLEVPALPVGGCGWLHSPGGQCPLGPVQLQCLVGGCTGALGQEQHPQEQGFSEGWSEGDLEHLGSSLCALPGLLRAAALQKPVLSLVPAAGSTGAQWPALPGMGRINRLCCGSAVLSSHRAPFTRGMLPPNPPSLSCSYPGHRWSCHTQRCQRLWPSSQHLLLPGLFWRGWVVADAVKGVTMAEPLVPPACPGLCSRSCCSSKFSVFFLLPTRPGVVVVVEPGAGAL